MGRPKIYTAEELREHRKAHSQEWIKRNPEKIKAAKRRYWLKHCPKRFCIYCGAEITGTKQKKMCKRQECQKRSWNKSQKRYRDKYPEKIRESHKLVMRREWAKIRAKRPLKRCCYCDDIIGDGKSYRKKVCEACRPRIFRDANKRYYAQNREKESKRKAIWFQENKKAIHLRQRARALVSQLEKIKE